MKGTQYYQTTTCIAGSVFVIFEPDIPAMPVAKDGTPVIQDSTECAPSGSVIDMLRSARGTNPKIERNTKSIDNP